MKKTWKSIIAIVLALSLLAAPVLADDTTSAFFGKLEDLITLIQTHYYKDVKLTDLMEGAFKGMFSALDKNSTYFNEQEYKKFMEQISGNFVGVGMYIDKKDDGILVIAPIEGSPAYRAGIKAGDIVITINGQSTAKMTADEASSIIRGPENTKVKLGIKREGVANILNFEVSREMIKINPITSEIMAGNIGYIRISQFNENTYMNIMPVLNNFRSKGVKGVVIDVRDNPGGYLDQVISICQELIPSGPIVHVQSRGEIEATYRSELAKAPFKVMMLVNGGSASASEIMAGAIKESGTGKLVGERTYGKGTVQNIIPLTDGTGLKITIANYLTPKEFSLDGIGIMPDFEVKATETNTTSEYAAVTGQKPIKQKDVSLEVLGVQQRLKALGYGIKTPDGVFGSGTLAEVKKFQKDNKLKIDGIMNTDDIKVLNERFAKVIGSKDAQLDKAVEELKKMIK